MAKIYIRSASCISPQNTFGDVPLLTDIVQYNEPRLRVIEPDYRQFMDPKQSRRMSRVIRMGVAAAKDCLQHAQVEMPDAIVTGTAYGCVEDTGIFLTRIIEQEEEMLSPTAFIQSTHNTVAAQIALALKCHAYNNTFVHKHFSFESALLDAAMLMEEGEAANVLVGGTDEITDINYAIFKRFNLFKKGEFVNTNLYADKTPGTAGGEGAAFFLLANEASETDLACIKGFETVYKPADIKKNISQFLERYETSLTGIDLVISGRNGNEDTDVLPAELENEYFAGIPVINYKHLCGEYPVASSFALWLAANIVKQRSLPPVFNPEVAVFGEIKTVLICNQYQNKYWSLMLLTAC